MTSRSSAPFRWRTRPSHSNHHPEGQEIVAHNSLSSEAVYSVMSPRQSTTATTRAKWKPVAYPKSAASWSTSQVGLLQGVGTWRAREVSVLESGRRWELVLLLPPIWMDVLRPGRGAHGEKSVQSESAVRCGAWGCRLGHQIPAGLSVHLWPWVSAWPSPCYSSDSGVIALQDWLL